MKQSLRNIFYSLIAVLLINISCKKEKSCEGCKENNKPPISIAGPDQVITLPTDSISLDGSPSSDPDGNISEWLWTKISGPASFNILNGAIVRTVVKKLVAGNYLFELKVTDNGGLSAKDTLKVMVDDPAINQPPIVNAGADQIITLPINNTTIDGSNSTDPENNIVSYLWTKISGPSSFNLVTPGIQQTQVTNLVQGVYLFELKVTDAGGLFSKDTVQITVDNLFPSNHPPVANAGPDQTIILPINSVTINGSASTDPDNNIISYSWTKISGSISFTFASSNAVQTVVSNLVMGIYQFELKVTDAGGLFSKDTVQVIVNSVPPPPPQICDSINRPLVNLKLIPVAVHPKPRMEMAIASAGNKLLFAGGGCYCLNDSVTTRVDIYDIINQTWSTGQLSEARVIITAVAAGDKIFFAGGEVGDGTLPVTTVDIYNVTTNQWSTSQLSTAGHSITAATVADKVLFAGGDGGFTGPGRERRVDIYNLTTNSWSTAQLSEPKQGPTAVTTNGKIFFGGGHTHNNSTYFVSDKIDIYDNATNTWSVAALNERRVGHGGIAVADKIYWAGGSTTGNSTSLLCSVEIRGVNMGSTVIQSLSEPSGGQALLKNNKILFFTINGMNDNTIDIYDVSSASWSIGVLPQNIYGSSVISVNNTIYVTGAHENGILSNQVWNHDYNFFLLQKRKIM
jgi:hypothetical protein